MRALFVVLIAGCSASTVKDGVPPAAACLANTCAVAADCAMGTRCNQRLSPPRCEQLYCGADGTLCDDTLLCMQGSVCAGGVCFSNLSAAEIGVGRPCVNPGGMSPAGAQISSPALECPSKLCLIEPTRATCTRNCDGDQECAGADASQCASGFKCAPVVVAGPFACKKLCVCADDVQMLTCP